MINMILFGTFERTESKFAFKLTYALYYNL